MNKKELNKILEQHRLWLESEGKKGERADLQGADLRHANLRHAYLQDTDLRHADLQGADLRHADLQGANLRDAHLQGAELRGAELGTNIRDCWSFEDAKFIPDALSWLILHPKWAEWKDSVQITPS